MLFARTMLVASAALLLIDRTNMAWGFQVSPFGVKCLDGGANGLMLRTKRNAPSIFCSAAMNFNEPESSTETARTQDQKTGGADLSYTMFFSSDPSTEEAARQRAKAARAALRRSQLVGETIPSDWTRGNHYRDSERSVVFGPGELVIFKGRFAVVQMYDDDGMVVVEAACGDAPGSRSMRHLGPTVLGKITQSSLQALLNQ
uniref:Chalcone isomerase domain-containing protein n=1 Tax=Cryptomonas curvata TaxID=233186 RepID=A0A7S0LY35_9CRYP